MAQRGRGERNWEEPRGAKVHTSIPTRKYPTAPLPKLRVVDGGNGFYTVTDGRYEWFATEGCDGVIEITEQTHPTNRRNDEVIRLLQQQ